MRKLKKPLEFADIPIHRHENCIGYKHCLAVAAKNMWPSFSCDGCSVYMPLEEEEELSPPESMDWMDRAVLVLG